MAARWYVLGCKLNKERAVDQRLAGLGYERFLPLSLNDDANNSRREGRFCFPGYIFVKMDLVIEWLSFFQHMPDTTGLENFNGKPAVVPDKLISGLRKRLHLVDYYQPVSIATNSDKINALDVDATFLDLNVSEGERLRAFFRW